MDEPSLTALVCNFCSATESAAGGPLLGCASCRVAAYCCAEHQQLDWSRHKVWCKVHSSREHSVAGSSQANSATSSSVAATASNAVPTAATVAIPKQMSSIRRTDSGHALSDHQTTSSNGGKKPTMTTSSSGSSQTSGHSTGTDCSLNSTGSRGAAAAASGSNATTNDQLAEMLASPDLINLLLQQQAQMVAAAPPLPMLPPAMDASALLAATSNPVNGLYSNLALMAQLTQQQQQQHQQPAPVSLPAPQLFPPLLGSLSQLGLSGFPMPPHPSVFPTAATFESLLATLAAASAATPTTSMPHQPRFDLGAADPTPLMSMNSLLSHSSVPSTSAFARPAPRPTLAPSSSFPKTTPFSSSFSSCSSSSSIPTTVPNPFSFDHAPSSTQKIIDPKPSMTVPPLRPKAVAARRIAGGKPAAAATVATAEAARDQWRPSSSGASTSSASTSAGASGSAESTGVAAPAAAAAPSIASSVKWSPDRYERPEGSRKRTTPSPQEDKKYITVDNNFIANMPLDWDGIHARLMPSAGAQVKDVRRPLPVVEDDDCQVIGEVINRRYKDHTQNVVYNVTTPEHMTDMRNKGILMSRHQAAVLRLRYIAEHTIRSLNEFGWAVVDNYLGQDHVGHCAKEMVHLYEKGLFTAGQLMDNSDDEEWAPPPRNEDDIKNVRSDYIYWYDGVDERATEAVTTRLLVSMLDAMIQHFENRIEGKTIGGRSRAMLAIYPGGSTRYVKHVDNPNVDGRLITCIYYCNANWNLKEHGGALRLFPETSECAMDIDPQADRLVFFWSDRRNPHEVMPVHRHRFAVTIWYMEKAERQAALERKAKRLQAARLVQAGVRAEHLADPEKMRMLIQQQPHIGKLLQFGSMRQTHASAPHMGNAAAAATASASALGLPPQAAAVGRAASPRSRSDNNMARRFEMARSECTQDEVESDEEEINDFIPPNNGAQPDYEI